MIKEWSPFTCGLILAGKLANSGLEAKVVNSSTASVSGRDASAHSRRFSSVKSLSNACEQKKEEILTQFTIGGAGWPNG